MNKLIHFEFESYLDNEPEESSSYWINRDILGDILFRNYKLKFFKWIDDDIIVLRSNDNSFLNLLILNHSKYIIKIEDEIEDGE